MNIITKYGSDEVSDDCFRVLLSAGNRPIVLRYVGDENGLFFLARGCLLIWNQEAQIFHIHPSLDTAIRSCVHIQAKYGRGDQRAGSQGEQAELSEMIARHDFLWDMVAEWSQLSEKERRMFTQASLITAKRLATARNSLRAGMGRRAVMAATVIDSLGRTNPPRTQSLHATVRQDGEQRLADVGRITFCVDRRMSVLLGEREKNLSILRRLEFEARRLGDCQRAAAFERSKKRIQELLGASSDLPFLHFFRRCFSDDLAPACVSMNRGDTQDAARRIKRLNNSIAVFWFGRELAELRLRLAFALSRRPHRKIELAALKTEFEALRQSMAKARAAGLDINLRNSPLPRAIRHLSVAFLEWGLGDFSAVAWQLDLAEAPF